MGTFGGQPYFEGPIETRTPIMMPDYGSQAMAAQLNASAGKKKSTTTSTEKPIDGVTSEVNYYQDQLNQIDNQMAKIQNDAIAEINENGGKMTDVAQNFKSQMDQLSQQKKMVQASVKTIENNAVTWKSTKEGFSNNMNNFATDEKGNLITAKDIYPDAEKDIPLTYAQIFKYYDSPGTKGMVPEEILNIAPPDEEGFIADMQEDVVNYEVSVNDDIKSIYRDLIKKGRKETYPARDENGNIIRDKNGEIVKKKVEYNDGQIMSELLPAHMLNSDEAKSYLNTLKSKYQYDDNYRRLEAEKRAEYELAVRQSLLKQGVKPEALNSAENIKKIDDGVNALWDDYLLNNSEYKSQAQAAARKFMNEYKKSDLYEYDLFMGKETGSFRRESYDVKGSLFIDKLNVGSGEELETIRDGLINNYANAPADAERLGIPKEQYALIRKEFSTWMDENPNATENEMKREASKFLLKGLQSTILNKEDSKAKYIAQTEFSNKGRENPSLAYHVYTGDINHTISKNVTTEEAKTYFPVFMDSDQIFDGVGVYVSGNYYADGLPQYLREAKLAGVKKITKGVSEDGETEKTYLTVRLRITEGMAKDLQEKMKVDVLDRDNAMEKGESSYKPVSLEKADARISKNNSGGASGLINWDYDNQTAILDEENRTNSKSKKPIYYEVTIEYDPTMIERNETAMTAKSGNRAINEQKNENGYKAK